MKNQYEKEMETLSEYDEYLFDTSYDNLKCQHYTYTQKIHLEDKLKRILDIIKPEDISSEESTDIENWTEDDWVRYNTLNRVYEECLQIYEEPTPNKYNSKPLKNHIQTFLNFLKDPSEDMVPFIKGYYTHHTIDNKHVEMLKKIIKGERSDANLELE